MVEVGLVQAEDNGLNIINAAPTKELFIDMLVRDLTLKDAIGDLVDNSIDGARKLISDENIDGKEFKIEITAKTDEFIIRDNCGGIEVDIARNYAFKFGRDKNTPSRNNSIGQFGIGMKRALFKLGKYFTIESIAKNSKFVLEVDVDAWQEITNWEFKFTKFEENLPDTPSADRGTTIVVKKLTNEVANQFSTDNFLKELKTEIEVENLYNLLKGIQIKLNDSRLTVKRLEIIASEEIKPAYWKYSFGNDMEVEIYCGISEPSLEDGGWYIFCNSRLVHGPEQTEISGWTGGRVNGGPKYHGQFNRFRGFVFFTAKNAGDLPWNTTKTGMNLDSPVYKFVRAQMIDMMRPIIAFLNKMKEERENGSGKEERVLENKVNNSARLYLKDLTPDKTESKFKAPDVEIKQTKKKTEYRIIYFKPKSIVDKVIKKLGVTSANEAGSKTFDYFVDSEIE